MCFCEQLESAREQHRARGSSPRSPRSPSPNADDEFSASTGHVRTLARAAVQGASAHSAHSARGAGRLAHAHTNTNTPDPVDVRWLVHQSQVGCVIGKGGTRIRELREVPLFTSLLVFVFTSTILRLLALNCFAFSSSITCILHSFRFYLYYILFIWRKLFINFEIMPFSLISSQSPFHPRLQGCRVAGLPG